jgi:hypothetical protein
MEILKGLRSAALSTMCGLALRLFLGCSYSGSPNKVIITWIVSDAVYLSIMNGCNYEKRA